MKKIDLAIGSHDDVRIIGDLFDEYETDELDQDILLVSLPNGRTIDVGWYPPYDRDGEFVVKTFTRPGFSQGTTELVTRDPQRVATEIKRLFLRYYRSTEYWPSAFSSNVQWSPSSSVQIPITILCGNHA